MKTYLFKSLLLFALLLGSGIAHSQVSYGYDAAGNRISRTVTLVKTAKATTDSVVQPAIESLGKLQIKIYPNPTRGQLKVEVLGLEEGESGSIHLFSMNGGLILKEDITSSITNLDISNQPTGTYVMKIVAAGESTTWKIIKE